MFKIVYTFTNTTLSKNTEFFTKKLFREPTKNNIIN